MNKLLVGIVTLILSISSVYADDKTKVESQSKNDTLYLSAPVETGSSCLSTYVSMNFYISSYSDSDGFLQEDQYVYVTVNTWDRCSESQTLQEGLVLLEAGEMSISDDSVTINNVTADLFDVSDSNTVTGTVSFDGVVTANPDSWHAWSDSKEGSVDPSIEYKYTSKSFSDTYDGVLSGELRFNNTLLRDVHSTIYQHERESTSTFSGELPYPPGKG